MFCSGLTDVQSIIANAPTLKVELLADPGPRGYRPQSAWTDRRAVRAVGFQPQIPSFGEPALSIEDTSPNIPRTYIGGKRPQTLFSFSVIVDIHFFVRPARIVAVAKEPLMG